MKKPMIQSLSGSRSHVIHSFQVSSRTPTLSLGVRRVFSNGFQLAKQQGRPAPPLRALPAMPSSKTKPPPITSKEYVDILLGNGDKTLLYLSPNHTTFYASSYLVGGAFLIGAYSWAQFALKDPPVEVEQPTVPKQPWWVRSLLTLEILVVVGLGTHFLLAPRNLIKSVSLVRNTSVSPKTSVEPLLSLEIKRALPFLKPDVLEAPLSSVLREPTVRASGGIEGLSVSIERAQDFTTEYFSKKSTAPPPARNGLLSSIWPAVRRDTRRMFVRDKMMYIRSLNHGSFKLDLQDSALVDDGGLIRLLAIDPKPRSTVFGYLRGMLPA